MVAQPVAQPRAAIYCRVSTPGQEEDGTSLGTQEQRCREYALEHGYAVDEAHVYRETFSGLQLWDRPQLSRLRDAVRRREVAAVVSYAIDRLARDPVHMGVVISEAEHAGVPVEFVTEINDNTPEGHLVRYIRGYAAKIEHEKIKERTLRAKRARAESGQLHNGGIDLYGYRRDKSTRRRSIVEAEAAVVRQVFRWYAEDQLPLGEIARRLNEAGVPPPSAGKWNYSRPDYVPAWSKSTLHVMIDNPAYKGEPYAWRRAGGSNTRPAEEWLKLDGDSTPAIVSPELWQEANTRRHTSRARQAAWTRNQKRPYLLRGRLTCDRCGRPLHCSTEGASPDQRRSGAERKRIYRCASREAPSGPCGAGRVPADEIEAWLWRELSEAIRQPERISRQIEHQREQGGDPALVGDLEAMTRELAKLTRQQERLVRRLRESDDDTFPWELIEREIASVEQEKRQLQAAIAGIEVRLAEQQAQAARLDSLADYCRQVASRLATFGFEERCLTLQAFEIHVRAQGTDSRNWHISGSTPELGVPSNTP